MAKHDVIQPNPALADDEDVCLTNEALHAAGVAYELVCRCLGMEPGAVASLRACDFEAGPMDAGGLQGLAILVRQVSAALQASAERRVKHGGAPMSAELEEAWWLAGGLEELLQGAGGGPMNGRLSPAAVLVAAVTLDRIVEHLDNAFVRTSGAYKVTTRKPKAGAAQCQWGSIA